METIAISKFKTTCLAVLERVRRTRKPVRITRFGEPVADVIPPAPPKRSDNWLGCLKDSGRIEGDLIEPAADASDWEALRS